MLPWLPRPVQQVPILYAITRTARGDVQHSTSIAEHVAEKDTLQGPPNALNTDHMRLIRLTVVTITSIGAKGPGVGADGAVADVVAQSTKHRSTKKMITILNNIMTLSPANLYLK